METQIRREDLLGEVERDVRDLSVVVLRDPLLDLSAELGEARQKLVERLALELEQTRARNGLDRCFACVTLEDRHLPEEVALPEVADVACASVELLVSAETAFLDHVHRAGTVALAHNDLALVHVDGPELSQHHAQCVGRKLGEGRVEVKEVLEVTPPDVQLEGFTDLRMRLEQGLEE
jgi:hypothetical protein